MALLLRRVRQAFGVRPEDVRLVATSATIGEGPETVEALRPLRCRPGRCFPGPVEVVMGQERIAALPPVGADRPLDAAALEGRAPDELWSELAPPSPRPGCPGCHSHRRRPAGRSGAAPGTDTHGRGSGRRHTRNPRCDGTGAAVRGCARLQPLAARRLPPLAGGLLGLHRPGLPRTGHRSFRRKGPTGNSGRSIFFTAKLRLRRPRLRSRRLQRLRHAVADRPG